MESLLEIGRSMRRSNARRAVLVALAALGLAYVAQIAERSRISHDRVLAVLHGDGRGFRVSLSLVNLELAERVDISAEGTVYAITARGRLIAKSLERGGLKRLVEGPVWAEAEAPVPARELSPAHTGVGTGVNTGDPAGAPPHARTGLTCPRCGAEVPAAAAAQ